MPSKTWIVTDVGIIPAGENTPRRSAGDPLTLRRIAQRYAPAIHMRAGMDIQRARVLAALIATESRGVLDPTARYEPSQHDYSFGPCQLLTRTAAALMDQLQLGARPQALLMPERDDSSPKVAIWRGLLTQPDLAVQLAAKYLSNADWQHKCDGDPVLLYACYNAGSPRASVRAHDAFGLVSAVSPDGTTALDHFAAWYGDACAVFTIRAPT